MCRILVNCYFVYSTWVNISPSELIQIFDCLQCRAHCTVQCTLPSSQHDTVTQVQDLFTLHSDLIISFIYNTSHFPDLKHEITRSTTTPSFHTVHPVQCRVDEFCLKTVKALPSSRQHWAGFYLPNTERRDCLCCTDISALYPFRPPHSPSPPSCLVKEAEQARQSFPLS